MGASGACHRCHHGGKPGLGRGQHRGATVERVVRAGNQAAFRQAADDALDGGRVHGDQPAEKVEVVGGGQPVVPWRLGLGGSLSFVCEWLGRESRG
jgi:hypothetical protein